MHIWPQITIMKNRNSPWNSIMSMQIAQVVSKLGVWVRDSITIDVVLKVVAGLFVMLCVVLLLESGSAGESEAAVAEDWRPSGLCTVLVYNDNKKALSLWIPHCSAVQRDTHSNSRPNWWTMMINCQFWSEWWTTARFWVAIATRCHGNSATQPVIKRWHGAVWQVYCTL